MRRARGWAHHLILSDTFGADEDDLDLVKHRDEIVRRFRNDAWVKQYLSEGSDLWWLIDELSDAEDFDHFNAVWHAVYDWADAHRLWIET